MQTISFKELSSLLHLPSQLHDHLIWVAATAELLCDNWNGPAIDRKALRRVLLLHDAGNLVKMETHTPEAQKLKAIFIRKFGSDDHKASEHIARAAGLSAAELSLMNRKIFLNNQQTMTGSDWSQKIAAYADQRAAPHAIMPLLARLNEAKERYKHRPGTSMNNPHTDALIVCSEKIEEQITTFISLPTTSITTERAEEYRHMLEHERFMLPAIDLRFS